MRNIFHYLPVTHISAALSPCTIFVSPKNLIYLLNNLTLIHQLMEKKNPSVLMNALTWGVIIGLISIVYSVVLYMLNQSFNRALGYAGIIILIAGLAFAMKNYRDSVLEGIMPFGKAFGFGVLIVVVSGLLGSIYTYLLYTVIDPELQQKLMEFSAEKMLESGRVTEDQLEQTMEFTKKFMSPVYLTVSGFIMNCIFGTIVSLIVAAIFKKEEA